MANQHRKPVEPPETAIDPAARRARRAFDTVSASALGLELGVAVIIGMLFGHWLDTKAGTAPWLMIVFIALGFAAGIRGMLRGAKRAERAQEHHDGQP